MVYAIWNFDYNMENGMWNVDHVDMEHGIRNAEPGEHGVQ